MEEDNKTLIENANKELQEVLKKYSVCIKPNIDFPIYRQLPDEVKLALSILQKHGVRIQFVLEEQPPKK